MTAELLSGMAREALIQAVLLSFPLVLAAALVGFLFGLLQAMTQLHDQTTAFAVKLIVVLGLLVLLAPWLGAATVAFGRRVMDLLVGL
jgi:type III secretion protein S